MSGLEITMIRRGDTLVPSCEMFREDLLAIPEGKEVFVNLRRARSAKHHRFFFAALQEIVTSGQWDGTVETLLVFVKIGLGHVTVVVGPTGKTFYVPKSIAWESMGEDEFTAFKKEFERFITTKMGVDIEAIYQAIAARSRLVNETPDESPPAPAVSVPQDNAPPSQLAERLRALADHLHFDTSEDFDEALAQARLAGRLRELERVAPKQTAAVIELCRKAASGVFDNAGFEEVLGKIVEQATAQAGKRRAA